MVYPDAFAGGGGARGWQNRAGDAGDRDLAFFDAMLRWLQSEHCVDSSRVFVLGYSNGAGLANLLACERSGVIAGVALAAGRLTCAPSHPMPIIISHGTRDITVSYEQAIQTVRAWSSVNRCSAPPRAGTPGCFAATACGVATTLCTHTGGHEYSSTFSRSVGEFFQGLAK
jgi:polyhydroxybutyrate depolymerase